MTERQRAAPKRLTGSGPAPSIGFLLDWLEDSRYHWQVLRGAMDAAYDRGANLVCFVGGALAATNMVNDANWIFELARPQNVDALLVLSGSLGNAIGSRGLAAYCARFQPMPMCSIALPLEGLSSVCIDNAEGMRSAVDHLIRVHGLTRVAFIRGPPANDEAEVRLRAYREALESNGLPYAPELVVSGDFTVATGRLAVSTLFGERKLPVSGVSAIMAANDSMALGAIEELRKMGIRVPDQVAVVGFDNVEEARFVLPPLTTVSQPLQDQGREAVRILLEQIRNPTRPEQAMRHTELMIRRSCGCLQGSGTRKSSSPPALTLGFDAALIRRRQHILADMARAARGELGAAGEQWDSRLLAAASEQIRGDSRDSFIRVYDDLLRRLLQSGADPAVCNDVISALRGRIVRCIGDPKQRMLAEDLFHEARLMTTQAVERIHVAKELRVWSDARELMQAGAAIMSARTVDELARAVHEHLPKAGIPRCFVIRLVEGPAGEQLAQLVLAEKPDARRSDPTRSTMYPVTDILRQTVLPGTDERAFAVFPAHIGETSRALVVLEIATAVEGYAYETMRQIFAVALSRISVPGP
jgi:sigma-B regulation protein RsbU (phosphoserine phosphatase)